MGNSNSIPESNPNKQELDGIKNVLAQDTESFTAGDYTSEEQYNEANANKPYYIEYIQAKTAYLAQKNGSTNSCSFNIGDIVKRKPRINEHEACELIGKVVGIVESHEWPIGSGKKMSKMYIINLPELFAGTPYANNSGKLAFPCCDLELIYKNKN